MARVLLLPLIALLAAPLGAPLWSQSVSSSPTVIPDHHCWVVPQSRAYAPAGTGAVTIRKVDVEVDIDEQVASTTMDVVLHNPSARQVEAEVLLPVPHGVAVGGFSFSGTAPKSSAKLLPADEARRTYDAIVRKLKDPGLLEFAGYQMIRSSVFPVAANSEITVRVEYDQVLTSHDERVDYVLPRSESLAYTVPWNITVNIDSKRNLSTVYSPSHHLDVIRKDKGSLVARFTPQAQLQPGSFLLSYLLEGNGITASMFSYPKPGTDGGFFLMLAGLPVGTPEKASIQREVTLVIDRSGSMKGEKIEQAKEAARQILEGLDKGESFNIVTYSDTVDRFAPSSVVKNDDTMAQARAYLARIEAVGGTNLHDALVTALASEPREDALPLVLFLTDGLPTVGVTNELEIRKAVQAANKHERRVFAFGVGVDVNTPLLDKISSKSRGKATFVLPGENVEVKVSQVFRRLNGPVLAGPQLVAKQSEGAPASHRVSDLLPAVLPDLFAGDQLVVIGRYHGKAPLEFEITGNYFGQDRTFEFGFDLANADVRNAFVPRLWASRKIGFLVEAIRDLGANPTLITSSSTPTEDPRLKELVEEVIALSTEYGVLTEYTAFLADEGTDLTDVANVLSEANGNFVDRAVNCRSGTAGVNQDYNGQQWRGQSCQNFRNDFYDENMNKVSVTGVQQVNDRAFFMRKNRWVDSRLVNNETDEPTRTIAFGSEAYQKLLDALCMEGRQGCLSLNGDILMQVGGETVLIEGPPEEGPKDVEGPPQPVVAEEKKDGC